MFAAKSVLLVRALTSLQAFALRRLLGPVRAAGCIAVAIAMVRAEAQRKEVPLQSKCLAPARVVLSSLPVAATVRLKDSPPPAVELLLLFEWVLFVVGYVGALGMFSL